MADQDIPPPEQTPTSTQDTAAERKPLQHKVTKPELEHISSLEKEFERVETVLADLMTLRETQRKAIYEFEQKITTDLMYSMVDSMGKSAQVNLDRMRQRFNDIDSAIKENRDERDRISANIDRKRQGQENRDNQRRSWLIAMISLGIGLLSAFVTLMDKFGLFGAARPPEVRVICAPLTESASVSPPITENRASQATEPVQSLPNLDAGIQSGSAPSIDAGIPTTEKAAPQLQRPQRGQASSPSK